MQHDSLVDTADQRNNPDASKNKHRGHEQHCFDGEAKDDQPGKPWHRSHSSTLSDQAMFMVDEAYR